MSRCVVGENSIQPQLVVKNTIIGWIDIGIFFLFRFINASISVPVSLCYDDIGFLLFVLLLK
jgi:hypothetical protein